MAYRDAAFRQPDANELLIELREQLKINDRLWTKCERLEGQILRLKYGHRRTAKKK